MGFRGNDSFVIPDVPLPYAWPLVVVHLLRADTP
jgi:hypothetical protein